MPTARKRSAVTAITAQVSATASVLTTMRIPRESSRRLLAAIFAWLVGGSQRVHDAIPLYHDAVRESGDLCPGQASVSECRSGTQHTQSPRQAVPVRCRSFLGPGSR